MPIDDPIFDDGNGGGGSGGGGGPILPPDDLEVVSSSSTRAANPDGTGCSVTVTIFSSVGGIVARLLDTGAGPNYEYRALESNVAYTFPNVTYQSDGILLQCSDSAGNARSIRIALLPYLAPIDPPTETPRCLDREADNYGAEGACVYTPRLELEEVELLVPNGKPVEVLLRSQPIGGTPAKATMLVIFFDEPAEGERFSVNGFDFVVGELSGPDRFQDATSLCAALQGVPQLAQLYDITQPDASRVLVVSKTEGVTTNLFASTTAPQQLVVGIAEGAPRYRSQVRAEWGLFLEVWAGCGDDFGGATDKSSAQLALRFEARSREDNTYTFDIADALKQFTSHRFTNATGHIPDRMVSYFLRFGEIYADQKGGFRRRRNVYESSVLWAIEAVEIPAESLPGVRVLSRRPLQQIGVPFQLVYLLLDSQAANELQYSVSETSFDGMTLSNSFASLPGIDPKGGVYCLSYNFSPEMLRASFGFVLSSRPTDRFEIARLQLRGMIPDNAKRSIEFPNRQGGFDSFLFEGLAEFNQKRSASQFQAPTGEQLRSVELELPVRLHSSQLDFATWDWLRRELATTPSARVNYAPVTISDVDLQSDPIQDTYSLSVEYKSTPIRGLSN